MVLEGQCIHGTSSIGPALVYFTASASDTRWAISKRSANPTSLAAPAPPVDDQERGRAADRRLRGERGVARHLRERDRQLHDRAVVDRNRCQLTGDGAVIGARRVEEEQGQHSVGGEPACDEGQRAWRA